MVGLRAFILSTAVVSNAVADPVPRQYLPPLPELKVMDVPAGDDVILPVTEGQASPITGQLFSPETALRWANWLQQYQQQSSLLLRTQERLCSNEIEYRERLLAAKSTAYDTVTVDFMKRIEALEDKNTKLQVQLAKGPRWYESRTFGIAIGAIGALGFTALSIWAIDAAAGD